MSSVLEKMITDERKSIAILMLERGKVSLEDIAIYSKLPLEIVETLAEKTTCLTSESGKNQ